MREVWQTKMLGAVCQIKPPKSEARQKLSDSDLVSFLPMEDLGVDQKFTNQGQSRPFGDVAGSYTYFAEGDVLLAKITPCFENGKLGIASGLTNGVGFGSSEYIVFRPEKSLSKQWLYYFLSRETFRAEGAARMSGAVGHKRVSKEFIETYPIPIPPLAEQQRIVSILDEAFEGIATAKANAERNLQNAHAVFASHLQYVFTQRGDGWVEKPLGDICDRVSVGHVGETSKFYCDAEEGIPFLRSQNVRRGFLDLEGVRHITRDFHNKLKKSQLRPGDLLFVRVGANRGDCAFVPDDLGEINCANIVFARPKSGNAEYLSRYCQSPVGRRQLLGMSVGSAQGVINTSSVAELVVPLPNNREQLRIVEMMNAMEEETQHLAHLYERRLAALEDLKKSLLHHAFTGQL